MSGLTTICPLDPSTGWCPEVLVEGGDAFAGIPEPPDPGPGDPDTPRVIVARSARRLQVLLQSPVTHDPIADLRTASVESWTERFGIGEASITVDTHDPGWLFIAERTTSVRGRNVCVPDLKGCEFSIGLEGSRVWTGVAQQPTGWGSGRIPLQLVSPEALWDERTLGETEQHDYYEGRGAFPDTDLTGWSFDANVAHSWNTTDQYEGQRSLRVEAVGVGGALYGPWVAMPGQDGQVRYPVGSALVHAPEGARVWVGVEVRLVDGSPVNAAFATENLGQNDDGQGGWQGPVAGRGQLTPHPVVHQVRVVVHLERNQPVSLDLVRLQWPTLTGFPSKRDLSEYVPRILRDAQDPNYGGVPQGFMPTIGSLTGVEQHITWPHQDDHPVGEAISSVTDMEGGPDAWVTPRFRVRVEARRGRDRSDVSLTPERIISCSMTIDPGGQVDELRGVTDIGSGSYRHVFGVDAPVRGNRRRIRQLVPVPNGLDYDAGRRWTRGQAEWAARTPFSAEVTVDFDYGARFGVGDGCLFAFDDGSLAWWGAVRVSSKTMFPKTNRCVMQVGTDPVVDL